MEEIDQIVRPGRIQFGFQRTINTLQASIYGAAVLEEAEPHLIAVPELSKAYDRVARQLLIDKIEDMKLPKKSDR